MDVTKETITPLHLALFFLPVDVSFAITSDFSLDPMIKEINNTFNTNIIFSDLN